MNKTLLQIQYYRLSSEYRKLRHRFEKALKENRFKNYTQKKQRQLLSRLEKMKVRLASLQQVLKLSGSALALGFMLSGAEVQAQAPLAAGSEFQVNTYTTNSQNRPSVAMDSDGDFVVTWQSFGQDGSGNGIYAQRYNAAGVTQGSEFRVNTYTTNNQNNPSIAMDSDGNFVVTWVSYILGGAYEEIYAKRYNASGVAQGSEFRVNTYTTSYQYNPSIAMDSDGDFVITWHSYYQDGSGYGIYAQRYNAAGAAQGSEFLVNTYTTNDQRDPSIAIDSDGDFVVTWTSNGQDGEGYGIYAQRYNAAGVAQGGEFRVNTYTTNDQRDPSVAMDSNGNFVITWQSDGQDGDYNGIYAQRYNAAGVAQGSEFLVNTYTTDDQRYPSITMDSNGNFVITWESYSQDGHGTGIYAQRYNASGVAQGGEFQVNTYTTSGQSNPSIASNSGGNFVVTWQSEGQDEDSNGIFGQRYTVPVAAGISKTIANNLVNIYPNPSSGQFTINSGNLSFDGYTMKVINLLGETVYQGSFTKHFDLSGVTKGIYTLMLESDDAVVVKQIVVH